MPVSVTFNGNVKKPKDVTVRRNWLCNPNRLTVYVSIYIVVWDLDIKSSRLCVNIWYSYCLNFVWGSLVAQ